MNNLESITQSVKNKGVRTILVLGNFILLHPGHIRLLQFAKSCGDRLIVGINEAAELNTSNHLQSNERLQMVQAIDCVDHAFISDQSAPDIIRQLKPWAVVKGSEFSEQDNPEQKALDEYGGQLIFGSGEFLSTADSIFEDDSFKAVPMDFEAVQSYASRHKISFESIEQYLVTFSNLNTVVIGEAIVDEYVQGKAVGMSQEDPTIVMTPTESNLFLGGAAITAGHMRSLGAGNVNFFTVIGEDKTADFVEKKSKDYQLTANLYKDSSRPTPLKTRYRVENKTLLRVNQLRQHKISKDLQNQILERLKDKIKDLKILVFSDFNYGLLPQELVEDICALCKKHGVLMVADSQTSSQIGDISRFHNMHLVTPTEKEVRVALNNSDDGLVVIADKLHKKSEAENIAITLGREGVFIHKPDIDSGLWENDQIPALNKNAIDPAGGGDSFLAAAALMLAAGADIWHAYYLASLASAYQVSRIGNSPIVLDELKLLLKASFKS